MTWMQVEDHLQTDDRCVLPLGSTEQHAYLSLATDSILADRMANDAAEPLGVPVFPSLNYGITPYFMGYPGTVTISPATYDQVLTEILAGIHLHGFKRILVVNGHGGNSPARGAAEAWAGRSEGVELLWHDWWKTPTVRAAVDEIDPDGSHASWMESFPWTRVGGVAVPEGHKDPVDLSNRNDLSLLAFREVLGDGSFGGDYERPDGEMLGLWDLAVAETRDLLMAGWTS
jgi:creatinine amidohydrolase